MHLSFYLQEKKFPFNLGKRSTGCARFMLLKQYLGIGKNNKKKLGLHLCSKGISLCVVDTQAMPYKLIICEFIEDRDLFKQKALLLNMITRLKLKGMPCYAVMKSDHYQLFRTDTPNVPAAELKEALFWQMQHFTTSSKQDCVFEAFYMPNLKANSKEITSAYIAIAQKKEVESLVSIISKSNLQLKNIDIEELSLRNIIRVLPDANEGIGLFFVCENHIKIILFKEGFVVLYRKIEISEGMLLSIKTDLFLLELQRSLDYFESQMMGSLIKKVYYYSSVESDDIFESLSGKVDVYFEFLDVHSFISCDHSFNEKALKNNFISIGAALRGANI